jgi:hypothetical protein
MTTCQATTVYANKAGQPQHIVQCFRPWGHMLHHKGPLGHAFYHWRLRALGCGHGDSCLTTTGSCGVCAEKDEEHQYLS